jgi:hypothetical protein
MTYIYTNNDTGEVSKVNADSEIEAFMQVIEHLLAVDGYQSLIEDALNIRIIDINQLKTI